MNDPHTSRTLKFAEELKELFDKHGVNYVKDGYIGYGKDSEKFEISDCEISFKSRDIDLFNVRNVLSTKPRSGFTVQQISNVLEGQHETSLREVSR